MRIRFLEQVLIGTHVYGEGEVVEADEKLARHALSRGNAVEYVEPVVREAVADVKQVRKAVARKSN